MMAIDFDKPVPPRVVWWFFVSRPYLSLWGIPTLGLMSYGLNGEVTDFYAGAMAVYAGLWIIGKIRIRGEVGDGV